MEFCSGSYQDVKLCFGSQHGVLGWPLDEVATYLQ